MNKKVSFYEKLHYIHRCVRYRFRTEKQQLSKLLSFNLKGKTVFDIGGNHGIYTYFLAKAVGPSGSVYVFEPQPELVVEIEKLLKWLKFNCVKLYPVGLSDVSIKRILSRRNVGDGGATLECGSEQVINQNIEIQTTTIDEFCSGNDISSIGYMKIDVEGHELSVIKGGINSIRNFKPIIQIELRVDKDSCDKVISILNELGYDGVMLLDGREIPILQYKNFGSKYFGFSGHRDFIFQPI